MIFKSFLNFVLKILKTQDYYGQFKVTTVSLTKRVATVVLLFSKYLIDIIKILYFNTCMNFTVSFVFI